MARDPEDWLEAARGTVSGVGGFDDTRQNERDTRALVGGASALIAVAEDVRVIRESLTSVEVLETARELVQAGPISSGIGPVAPTFDEFDRETEAQRGRWHVVDAEALDRLTTAVAKLDLGK